MSGGGLNSPSAKGKSVDEVVVSSLSGNGSNLDLFRASGGRSNFSSILGLVSLNSSNSIWLGGAVYHHRVEVLNHWCHSCC